MEGPMRKERKLVGKMVLELFTAYLNITFLKEEKSKK